MVAAPLGMVAAVTAISDGEALPQVDHLEESGKPISPASAQAVLTMLAREQPDLAERLRRI